MPLFALMIAITFFRDDSDGSNADNEGPPPSATATAVIRVDPGPGPAKAAQLDPLVAQVFKTDFAFADVRRADRAFADAMAFHMDVEGYTTANAQAYVRAEMMRVRSELPDDDLLAVSRLYLGWLRDARVAGGDACQAVLNNRQSATTAPPRSSAAPPNAEAQEAALARKLLAQGSLSLMTPRRASLALSEGMFAAAMQRTGLTREELGAALGSQSDPRRCDAAIALLELLLDRPDDAALRALPAL